MYKRRSPDDRIFCCQFCNAEKIGIYSLRAHEIRCRENPNKIISCFATNIQLTRKRSNQFIKAKELGLPIPHMTEETKQKLSISLKQRMNSDYWTPERREQQSKFMKKAVINHPESYSSNNVCGRVKNINYNGINLSGSWELLVAMWFDSIEIRWIRNCTGFEYFWPESNKTHIYYPDFYLPDYDYYVEVKGYERERDRCKWSVIDNLLIFKESQINNIRKGMLSIIDLENLRWNNVN